MSLPGATGLRTVRRSLPIRTTLRTIGILLLVASGVAASNLIGFTQTVDTTLADWRFATKSRPASGDIVLVDIDARSLAEVGVWPWPRSLHGDLVRAAASVGAARIAFDVDFSSASRASEDEAFADALARSGIETFLAAFVQPDTAASDELRASLPIASLLDASWPAAVNVPIDGDGRVRRFPRSVDIGDETVASLPVVLSSHDEGEGEFAIDHAIAVATLPRVSYVDLLDGRVAVEALRGKSLIVGATAIELHDLFPVPNFGIVSGSTVIALATETLLQDRALAAWVPARAVLFALLGAGALIVLGCSLGRSLPALLGLALATEALAVWLYLDRAVMARTAELQLGLLLLAFWSLAREFDLRRLLLWAARTRTENTARLLERIVDDGFDAIVVVEETGRIIRANEAARLLLDPASQRVLADLSHLPDLAHRVRLSLETLKDGPAPLQRMRGTETIRLGSAPLVVEYSIAAFEMAEERATSRGTPPRRFAALMLRDVTERERAQERLRFAALHDGLTGLPNRRALEEDLDAYGGLPGDAITLLAFDLDRFKDVNDALGHATGDAVLVEAARRILAELPRGASLYRIGGDEFVIVQRTADAGLAHGMAQALVRLIAEPFLVQGHCVSIGTRVGICMNADGDTEIPALRRRADVALHQAKQTPDRHVVTFDIGMETIRLERLALERDLKEAIDDDAFEVAYQPQIRLADGEWTGAEALLRWRHPVRGFVSPAEFIPVAEEMGLIHELGTFVLRTACRDACFWPPSVKVAVNVSPLQLMAGDIVGAVRAALASSGLEARRLELEITETAFVGDGARLPAIFEELLALGVTFALDDFGTGYSSLGYLHRFPISKIKIDRSFVADIPGNRHSMAVLRSVMALAEGLAIRAIAEGIETPEQAGLLGALGCHEGQGYLFSRPIPADAVIAFAQEHMSRPALPAPLTAAA